MRRIHDQKARPKAMKFRFFEPVIIHNTYVYNHYSLLLKKNQDSKSQGRHTMGQSNQDCKETSESNV